MALGHFHLASEDTSNLCTKGNQVNTSVLSLSISSILSPQCIDIFDTEPINIIKTKPISGIKHGANKFSQIADAYRNICCIPFFPSSCQMGNVLDIATTFEGGTSLAYGMNTQGLFFVFLILTFTFLLWIWIRDCFNGHVLVR